MQSKIPINQKIFLCLINPSPFEAWKKFEKKFCNTYPRVCNLQWTTPCNPRGSIRSIWKNFQRFDRRRDRKHHDSIKYRHVLLSRLEACMHGEEKVRTRSRSSRHVRDTAETNISLAPLGAPWQRAKKRRIRKE